MISHFGAFCYLISLCVAFVPSSERIRAHSTIFSADAEEADLIRDLDEKRKAELYANLLRDLQIEGVPLLECDADQVHTLQAALWATMGQLSEQDYEERACLIFDKIPIAALQALVDDFLVLKTQESQIEHLPELSRFTVSLLGKGLLGPAVILDIANKTDIASTTEQEKGEVIPSFEEFQCSAAMKAFMDRVVVGTSDDITIGLGNEGSAAPIQYRFSPSSNVCATLSSFWNCICELMSLSDKEIGTCCLQIPAIGSNDLQRFAAVSQLLSRSLCLYRGDSVFSLVHFHPQYDRSIINPIDKPAFGHLPPISWLKPMLKANGDDTDSLDDESLLNVNFLRRAPIPAINIVRNSLLDDPKIVTIELDNGPMEEASGLEVYCPNISKLAVTDHSKLQAALDAEIAHLS